MKKKKKMTTKKRRTIKLAVFAGEILVLIVVLAGLYMALKLSKINSNVQYDSDLQVNSLDEETTSYLSNYTTIVLFGLDNRSSGNLNRGLSDVIIICSINKETYEVRMASVYRDTYLDIGNDKGFRKCNSAYSYGGATQAINMLNTNLDLDIDGYITVDFNAVAETVDLLGGIEIEITGTEARLMTGYIEEIAEITGKQANYLTSGGTYLLDGVQATAYCRIRYTSGGDYKRTERQRLVIQKMVEKALTSNLSTIDSIIDTVFPDIQTNMTILELLQYAANGTKYSITETTGFPFDKTTMTISSKGDCVIPIDLAANVAQLHAFLYDQEDYQVTAEVQTISQQIMTDTGVVSEE